MDFWKEVESTFGTHFPNDSSHGTAAYNVGYGGYTCEDVKNESSDFISAFSTLERTEASQGLMVSSRGSGTEIVAS